ncbi:hypothetical protein FDP41_010478 [Naegleria fowleri]|uniref:Uncharacterized protein n=1 Tax=Naegleria fowleri TaxID=5763 RepID=A0A6A5BZ44_NAEFO|nr:uncharacterized protein FDP41_010478 [Naegleria fowleri]KAF0983413.1 hypothetical protein FDP41_010478 [Naegleria fowleri]CAG4715912.1 unnamed protein product [Naegleria fowleri]
MTRRVQTDRLNNHSLLLTNKCSATRHDEIPSGNPLHQFSLPNLKTSQYSSQTSLRNMQHMHAAADQSSISSSLGEREPIPNNTLESEIDPSSSSIQHFHQEEMFPQSHHSSTTQLFQQQETLLQMYRDLGLLMSDEVSPPTSSSSHLIQPPPHEQQPSALLSYFGVDHEMRPTLEQPNSDIVFLNNNVGGGEDDNSRHLLNTSFPTSLLKGSSSSNTYYKMDDPTTCMDSSLSLISMFSKSTSQKGDEKSNFEKSADDHCHSTSTTLTNAPISTSHQPTSLSSFDESSDANLKSFARPSQLQSSSSSPSITSNTTATTNNSSNHEEALSLLASADTVEGFSHQPLLLYAEKRKHQRSSSSPIASSSSSSSPQSSPHSSLLISSNSYPQIITSQYRKTRKPSPLLLSNQKQQQQEQDQNNEMMFMNNNMVITMNNSNNSIMNPQTTLGGNTSMLFPTPQGLVNISNNNHMNNVVTMNQSNCNNSTNMMIDPMTLASALLSGQINLSSLNEEQLNTLRLLISDQQPQQQLSSQAQQQQQEGNSKNAPNMLFMNQNTPELVTTSAEVDSHAHARRHSVASQMSLDSVYSSSLDNQKILGSTLKVSSRHPNINFFQDSPASIPPPQNTPPLQNTSNSFDPASNIPSNANEIYSLIDNALSGCTSSLGLKLVSATDILQDHPVNMNSSSPVMPTCSSGRSRTLSSPAMYSPNLSPNSSAMSTSSSQFLQVASNDSTSQISPVSPQQPEPFNFSSFREQYQQQFTFCKSESSITALKGNTGKQYHQRHYSTPAITITETKPRSRKKSIAKSSPASPMIHIPSIQVQGVETPATSVSTVTAAIPKRTRRNSLSSIEKDNSSVSSPLTKQNKMQNTLSKTIVFNNYYDEIQFKKKHGPNCTFYKFTEYK